MWREKRALLAPDSTVRAEEERAQHARERDRVQTDGEPTEVDDLPVLLIIAVALHAVVGNK